MRESPNRILEFLTTPAKPNGDSCRSNRRRRSSVRIELAWFDAEGWRTARARLRDISRGGASLIARVAPPVNGKARLRFLEGEGSPWIEAEIAGVEADSSTRHRIRLKFDNPCPSFLLRLAILDVSDSQDEIPAVRHEWVPVEATFTGQG